MWQRKKSYSFILPLIDVTTEPEMRASIIDVHYSSTSDHIFAMRAWPSVNQMIVKNQIKVA